MEPSFAYGERDFVTDVWRTKEGDAPAPSSRFDSALTGGWTDRLHRGLLRYHLGDLRTRVLPGPPRYVAQLNTQRGLERRKPQAIVSVNQPFSARQFNFNKINPEEVLFEMTSWGASEPPDPRGEKEKMVVVVNVSPLEFGHCLLVPDPSRCLPQVLTRFAVQAGIESVLLSSDPAFRVGFNSLGGFASVNHLHLHGYYLNHELAIESMAAKPLAPERGFYRLSGFPTGFLFYTEAGCLAKVAGAVFQVTDFLVNGNYAHNLFLTRGCPPCEVLGKEEDTLRRGVRIAVWPRISCFGAKEESAFNVALCELAGHLPFKRKEDFDHMTDKEIEDTIQRYLLPEEEFLRLETQLTAKLMEL